jgi:hypothetical protein
MAVEPKEPSFSVGIANEAVVGEVKRLEDIAGQDIGSEGSMVLTAATIESMKRMRAPRSWQGIGLADCANTSVSAHADSVKKSVPIESRRPMRIHISLQSKET